MEIKDIEFYRNIVYDSFNNCLPEIINCDIISRDCMPEGIKPHTRSIAWIAEQVIIQALRKHIKITKFDELHMTKSDIDLSDCIATVGKLEIKINVKVTASKKRTKNDINKAYKIYKRFTDNPDELLFYVVLKMNFTDNQVRFSNEKPTVFYVPHIKKIYVNPSNRHLQSDYYDEPVIRTSKEFTDELIKQIKDKKIEEK